MPGTTQRTHTCATAAQALNEATTRIAAFDPTGETRDATPQALAMLARARDALADAYAIGAMCERYADEFAELGDALDEHCEMLAGLAEVWANDAQTLFD